MADEEIVVDPKTGGMKGEKLSQLGWADPLALIEVGKVFGFGAKKYAPTNYRKGYRWSLSVNALERHLLLWLSGESRDQESNLLHTAHIAWHSLCLLCFELRGLGSDDVRWLYDDVENKTAHEQLEFPFNKKGA